MPFNFTLLEKEVIPMYYTKPNSWMKIMKQSMKDIIPMFDSNRMAREYYEKIYTTNPEGIPRKKLIKELVVN